MPELPFDSPSALMRGETVVFTGKLWSLGRKEARALVAQLGGQVADDLTQSTTLLVLGGDSYPDGLPADVPSVADLAPSHKLRRAVQLRLEHPGRLRIVSEDDFCRRIGRPPVSELRQQHYGQRVILTMYPALREDHLRYLQKWGFLKPAFRNHADAWFTFADLTLLRQVHTELQQGVPFRAVLRGLQAGRTGQLTFDFRLDAPPARIIALLPRELPAQARPAAGAVANPLPDRPLTAAEQYFLTGSLLDNGTPVGQEEAAEAYRRALRSDPDLPAAIINLANIRYARDELAEAQALYERAIRLDPTYFEAHFNLGNIHHDHGQYAQAEAAYREALALNPSYADAHFYLAVTFEKMGRSAAAQTHWRAYQRLAPAGEWVELAREFSD